MLGPGKEDNEIQNVHRLAEYDNGLVQGILRQVSLLKWPSIKNL
jgi:hypothetical protein